MLGNYVGIPYVNAGRDRNGIDCWGLVRLFYFEQYKIELVSGGADYAAEDGSNVFAKLTSEAMAEATQEWERTDNPNAGDIVLLRILGYPSHIGIVVSPGKMLHARSGIDSAIESIESGAWRHRIDGYYRHKSRSTGIAISGCPHPLKTVSIAGIAPEGSSLMAMIEIECARAGVPDELVVAQGHAWIDGEYIPASEWVERYPVEGQRVEYRLLPRGGGSRGLLMLAMMVVVAIAMPYIMPMIAGAAGVTVGSAGYLALQAGVGMALNFAGMMLVNAIAPVRQPGGGASDQIASQYHLQGGSNRVAQYGAIPVVLGQFRWTPVSAALPYAESDATDSYIRIVLCWGYGPLDVSDLRIGDTPLANFSGVTMAHVRGVVGEDLSAFNRLYGKDFSQENVSVKLVKNVAVNRTTAANVDDIKLIFSCPQGIWGTAAAGINAGKNVDAASVYVSVKIKPMGAPDNQFVEIGQTIIAQTALLPIVYDEQTVVVSGGTDIGDWWFQTYGNTRNRIGDVGRLPLYQWTRITIDTHNNLQLRHGCLTDNKLLAPSATLLAILEAHNFGLQVTYDRLPPLMDGEESLWLVCVNGETVSDIVDLRDVSVTGCALTVTGLGVAVAAGTITRSHADTVIFDYATKKAFDRVVNFPVARGQYDVRVTATKTEDPPDPPTYPSGNPRNAYADVYWTYLSGISNTKPITPRKPLAMTAIRIKATNQLNGTLEGITGTVKSICLDYDVTPPATNICLQSNGFATTPWTQTGTPTPTQNVADIDGVANSAWTLTDNNAAATEYILQSVALTAAAYTFSIYIKKTTGAPASYPVISVQLGTTIALATIDTTNGVATAWTAYTGFTMLAGIGATCTSHNFEYWRVSLKATGTAASYNFNLIPAGTTNATQSTGLLDIAAQGSAVFYGAQVELGSVATYYIPTTTTSATRSQWVTRNPRNPASLFRYVLQHPASAMPVADADIDLVKLAHWHNFCRMNGFAFDFVSISQRPLLDVLRDIAAAGRASPQLVDGKWSVVIDEPKTTIVQHFTPHNSWGFEGNRILPKRPHAFRIQFNNKAKGYQPDERIVYDDGYSAANATLIESIQLPGITDASNVHAFGRFHLAQLQLRPDEYVLNADMEHLICTRGDLVRVTHDVPMWGLGSGRIREVLISGANATGIVVDESFPMATGVAYSVRIRRVTGASLVCPLVAAVADGYYNTLTFITPITASLIAANDLLLYGQSNLESVELLVNGIQPDNQGGARLSLVDYAPGIQNADTEVIPPYDSQITKPPKLMQAIISQIPLVAAVISDESVITIAPTGGLISNIKVSFGNVAGLPNTVTHIELQYGLDAAMMIWESLPQTPLAAGSILIPNVIDGHAYRFRMRFIAWDGLIGKWSTETTHTVVGKTSPPPDISSFSIDGGTFNITPVEIPDLAGYKIKYHFGRNLDWLSAIPLHTGLVLHTPFKPAFLPFGILTFMAKAVDTGARESLNTANIFTNTGDPVIPNILEQFNFAPTFPGTYSGCSVVGGELVADALDSFYDADIPIASFYGLDADSFYAPGNFVAMTYSTTEWDITQSLAGSSVWLDLVAQYDATVTVGGTQALTIEYRQSGPTPLFGNDIDSFYTDAPGVADAGFYEGASAWIPWPGKMAGEKGDYELRVTIAAGTIQGKITTMTVTVDAQDLVEALQNVPIAIGGTVPSYTKPFATIKYIHATLQANASGAVMIEVDKTNPLQPIVKAYNSTHTAVAGATADLTIGGY